MSAMIDVVFQLIIFFVATTNMQEKMYDDRIKLAMAPNGKAETKRDRYEVRVNLNAGGDISISRQPLTANTLTAILRKARADSRGHDVPVLIMADFRTKHRDVKKVMDACTAAGIWKIKFTAFKEKA